MSLHCGPLYDMALHNCSGQILSSVNYNLPTSTWLNTKIEIDNATKETRELNLKIKDSLKTFCRTDFDFENIKPTIELNNDISAPINKNDVLGSISYEIEGITYKSDLLAYNSVEKKNYYWIIIVIRISNIIFGNFYFVYN